jgi:hypothetical protein
VSRPWYRAKLCRKLHSAQQDALYALALQRWVAHPYKWQIEASATVHCHWSTSSTAVPIMQPGLDCLTTEALELHPCGCVLQGAPPGVLPLCGNKAKVIAHSHGLCCNFVSMPSAVIGLAEHSTPWLRTPP